MTPPYALARAPQGAARVHRKEGPPLRASRAPQGAVLADRLSRIRGPLDRCVAVWSNGRERRWRWHGVAEALTRLAKASRGWRARCVALLAAGVLAGCASGPDYQRPAVAVGPAFKEAAGWKAAQPADDLPRGDWWRLFGDAELDALMRELERANPSLAQAEAQYRQAQAVLQGTQAGRLPTVSANASATRSGTGTGSSSTTNANGTVVSTGGQSIRNQFSASLGASWEIDLWGRVRRGIEADTASAEASAATLANARLSAQSTLARTYFELRVLDEQERLLAATLAVYDRTRTQTANRHAVGVAARAEVAQAETQFESTRAQAIDLRWQRAQREHAIALLVGRPPSQFSLAPRAAIGTVPDVPLSLPSTLLERRPDVAAAERQMQAANARIGVAQAAYFPTLSLSANLGWRNAEFSDWLTAPSRFWSLGPALAMSLFDGGLRRAQTAQAQAAYDAQAAGYRQTVLAALGEVEDALVQLRVLDEEAAVQQRALDAARQAAQLTTNQFEAGMIDYLSLANVQTAALSNARTMLALQGNQLAASVRLIAALGGGWTGLAQEPVAAASTPGPATP